MSVEADNEPVTLVGLIDQLVPPPTPPAVSMLPETMGWVFLAIAVGALALLLSVRLRTYKRLNAYRHEALTRLSQADGDPAKIAEVIRRTALVAYPRTDVASMSGEVWLRFLDETGGEANFSSGVGRLIAAGPYNPRVSADANLEPIAARWIKRHKRRSSPK